MRAHQCAVTPNALRAVSGHPKDTLSVYHLLSQTRRSSRSCGQNQLDGHQASHGCLKSGQELPALLRYEGAVPKHRRAQHHYPRGYTLAFRTRTRRFSTPSRRRTCRSRLFKGWLPLGQPPGEPSVDPAGVEPAFPVPETSVLPLDDRSSRGAGLASPVISVCLITDRVESALLPWCQ